MWTNLLTKLAPLTIAALVLVACAGPGGPAASAPLGGIPSIGSVPSAAAPATAGSGSATDMCGLVTTTEIEKATGSAARTGEPTTYLDGTPACRWALDSGVLDFVELSLVQPGGREKFDYYATDYYEVAPERVSGIGDGAVKTGTTPGGTIYVLRGDALLMLRFSLPMEADDPYATVMPLAATALSRLP